MGKELYLIKPTIDDEKVFKELIEKWKAFGGRINPGLLKHYNDNYKEWLEFLRDKSEEDNNSEEVPQTLYFLKNQNGEILGATSLRHYLNHTNDVEGGHIAYGICPEYRKNGYGKLILSLALEKLLQMGITRSLVTCDSDNIPSEKVILSNGGTYENEVFSDGKFIKRYWVEVNTK